MYPLGTFSECAKKALTLAQDEAQRSRQSSVDTEHVLVGLVREREGLAAKVLDNLGVEINTVRRAIESAAIRNRRNIMRWNLPTSRIKKVIEISFEEARRSGHDHVATQHLLLGLLIEGQGKAARVLNELGATLERVRPEIERLLPIDSEEPEPKPHVFNVGDRVLVHDPDPPYRLWEGRVARVEELRCDVSIPGRSEGELVKAELKLIHPVPMDWTHNCPFCKLDG
jgi:ATP-dependent Clp protease ATP-binding subunit ClpA